MAPLLWFRFRAERRTWRVYLVDELQGYWGQTDFTRREIFLHASMGRWQRERILLHEMAHAAFAWARHIKRCEQHRAITIAAEVLTPVLRRMGFRAPRLPKGFRALQRTARKCPPWR